MQIGITIGVSQLKQRGISGPQNAVKNASGGYIKNSSGGYVLNVYSTIISPPSGYGFASTQGGTQYITINNGANRVAIRIT